VRQVDNKRQAHSGRVHWHVRPPLGSDTSAQQIISACFGSLLPGVPNAAIDRAGINYATIQVLDERQSTSAPVESLVRPPSGCDMPLGRLILTVACRNFQACLTPRFTRREESAQPFKLTMRGKLIPVGCNCLLDRLWVAAR
jgi:hypothetical protein